MALSAMFNHFLSTSKDDDSTISLGSSFQRLRTLLINKFLLMINLVKTGFKWHKPVQPGFSWFKWNKPDQAGSTWFKPVSNGSSAPILIAKSFKIWLMTLEQRYSSLLHYVWCQQCWFEQEESLQCIDNYTLEFANQTSHWALCSLASTVSSGQLTWGLIFHTNVSKGCGFRLPTRWLQSPRCSQLLWHP